MHAAWLRDRNFDLVFILGTAGLACLSGMILCYQPSWFPCLLALDVGLLGWHHIISTFTCFVGSNDGANRRRWLLLSILPVGVLVSAMALSVGGWLVATVYLHWQWWHYTRQSEGIAKAFASRAKRAGGAGYTHGTRVALYAVAVWGIAVISARSPGVFLDMPVVTYRAPAPVVWGLGGVAFAAVAVWALEQVVAWRRGNLFWGPTLYMITHVAVFTFGWGVIASLNTGWFVLNVWHNAQYLMFVWNFNANRFKGGDVQAPWLASLSQPSLAPRYLLVCLACTAAVFLPLHGGIAAMGSQLPLTLIVVQTINFHHYLVDSFIWKLRRPKIAAAVLS